MNLLRKLSFSQSVLAISFLVYFSIGFLFSYYTEIVYNTTYACDLYFGYDNALHFTSFSRHPLLKIFAKVLSVILNFVGNSFFISLFLAAFCSLLLSVQNFFLFKILKNVFELSLNKVLVILIAFALSGTNLLLSFTFDSYVFSSCFMFVFLYLYLKSQKDGQELSASNFYGLSLLVGGTTITQFYKLGVFSFFSGKFRSLYLKRLAIVVFIFGITFIFVWSNFKESVIFVTQFFDKSQNFFYEVFDLFLGGLFLIPKVDVVKTNYIDGSLFYSVVAGLQDVWGRMLIGAMLALLSAIIFLERKNKLIKILLLSFILDIVLHVVLKFGLQEANIYTGNYNYIWPLLLALGFKNEVFLKFKLNCVLIIIAIFSLILNVFTLSDLFHFGKVYYGR